MKVEFWHERWETNQLGFHQTEPNPQLREYWPKLGLPSGSRVFVPLCGKSLDMIWLREAGHPVVGVEISPIATRDFFAQANVVPRAISSSDAGDDLVLCSGGGYDLYCGDFFALGTDPLADVRAVYDRASLIALPREMRIRYAYHLDKVLPTSVSILLLTVEYDSSRMKGPPHSVLASEVEGLFGESFEIECLWSSGPEEPGPRFRERGLDSWTEKAWRLTRGGAH